MRISRVSVYSLNLPTDGGGYRRQTGFAQDVCETTIVQIDTDEGITGFGEMCPTGPYYMQAFSEGAVAGIPVIAKHLIGEDPIQIERLNKLMDVKLKGQNYVKSAIDIALWDIAGKAFGRPVCELLGGRYDKPVPLYRTLHLFKQHDDTPEMLAQRARDYKGMGYKHLQIKGGNPPDRDIANVLAVAEVAEPTDTYYIDANTGWSLYGAMKVAKGIEGTRCIIEQPCATLEEIATLRKHTNCPIKLDESMETIYDLLRAHQMQAIDICCIKIGRVGGLTKARRMRDMCVELGISVVAEETWGSDFAHAAAAHFAQSTHSKFIICSTDLANYLTIKTADGTPVTKDGCFEATNAPGLGLTPRMDVLGKPVAVIEKN